MNNKHGSLAGMGGWLYADLLLILFIGVLTQLPTPKPASMLKLTPTTMPTATLTPTVTPTLRPTTVARLRQEYSAVDLRSTPSIDGDVQGELQSDSLVYVVDDRGEWASVVITTFVQSELLFKPDDPVFLTPLPVMQTLEPEETAGPTPTATALQSLSKDKIDKIMIVVPPNLTMSSSFEDRVAFRKVVVEQIRQKLPDARIGMVLTFGGAPPGQPGVGGSLAARTNELLREDLGFAADNLFLRAGFESFHDFTVPLNTVELWIYIYVN